MKIQAPIKVMGNTIVVQTKFPVSLEDGEYEINISPPTKDKTQRQLNYFWGLMRAIAIKQDGNAKDLELYYGQILKRARITIKHVRMQEKALDDFKKLIPHFIVLERDSYAGETWCDIEIYKGISQMSVEEMQQVISLALDYAQKIGIDTSEWEGVLLERS